MLQTLLWFSVAEGWDTAVPHSSSHIPAPTLPLTAFTSRGRPLVLILRMSCSLLCLSKPKLTRSGTWTAELPPSPHPRNTMGPTPNLSWAACNRFLSCLVLLFNSVLVFHFSRVISYLPSSLKRQHLCFALLYVSLST